MMRLLLAMAVACTPGVLPAVVEIPPPPVRVGPDPAPTPVEPTPEPRVAAPMPFADGQSWVGAYVCAQGETRLALNISRVDGDKVMAIFVFTHEPSGAAGSYDIEGTYDPPTSRASFTPGKWHDHPSGYVSVGLSGKVNGDVFLGRVDHDGCSAFSVKLVPDDMDQD